MKTFTQTPPVITQYFQPDLLSAPCPSLRESSKDIWRVYQYIKEKLEKKCKTSERIEKFKKLEKEFLDLYEQAIKEEKLKEKTEHHTQRFLYHISSIDKKDESIFRRLEYRKILSILSSK